MLKAMKKLNLRDTRVSGAGLRQLGGLRALSELSLWRVQVDDGVLRSLREIGLLHALEYARDKKNGRPGKLDEIHTLHLRETQVTDRGLDALKNLKTLKVLDLSRTRVTFAGVTGLRQALPDCEVVVQPY